MGCKARPASSNVHFWSAHIFSFGQGTGLPDPFGQAPFTGAAQLAGPKCFASIDATQHWTGVSTKTTQHSCFAPQSSKSPASARSFPPQASRHFPPSMEQDSDAKSRDGSAIK
jgi:hypothetical protein